LNTMEKLTNLSNYSSSTLCTSSQAVHVHSKHHMLACAEYMIADGTRSTLDPMICVCVCMLYWCVCVCLFVNCRLTYGPRAQAQRLANAEGTAQAIGQRLDTARADAKAQVCVCVCLFVYVCVCVCVCVCVREREREESIHLAHAMSPSTFLACSYTEEVAWQEGDTVCAHNCTHLHV